MNEQNKHIDDIFREALGNYAETPPAGAWQDIEQRLPAATKRRPGFGGWGWRIVLLLLLVSGGLIVARKMLHKEHTDIKQITRNTSTAHPENNNTITNGTTTTNNNNNNNSQPTAANSTQSTTPPGANQGTSIAPANAQPVTPSGSAVTPASQSAANTAANGSRPPAAASGANSATAARSGVRHSRGRRSGAQRHSGATNAATATAASGAVTSTASTAGPQNAATGSLRHRNAKNRVAHSGNSLVPASNTGQPGTAIVSSNPRPARNRHRRNNAATVANAAATATNPVVATPSKRHKRAHTAAGNTSASTAAATTTPARHKHRATPAENTNAPATAANPVVAATPARHKKPRNAADNTTTNTTAATVTPARHARHKHVTAPADNTVAPPVAAAKPVRPKHKKAPAVATAVPAVAAAAPIAAKPRHKKTTTAPADAAAATPVAKPRYAKRATQAPVAQQATNQVQPKKKAKPINPSPVVAVTPKPQKPKNAPAVKAHRLATAPSVAKAKKKATKQQPSAQKPVPAASQPVAANPKPATAAPTPATTFPKQTQLTDPNDKPFLKQPVLADNGSDNIEAGGSGGGGGGGGGSDKPAKKRKPINVNLDAGVFAGYEKGFSTFNIDKTLFGAYLHYHFSAKLGLMVPLSYKFGNFNSDQLSGSGTFYQIQNVTLNNTLHPFDSIQQGGIPIDTVIYNYSQTYDSIHVASTATRKVWEVDLPLLLSLQVSPGLTVFAGPVVSFGNQIKFTSTISHTLREYGTIDTTHVQPGTALLDTGFFATQVAHSGLPFSSNDTVATQNATTNPLRIGYMLGLQFTTGSFNFNLSVQQSLSGTSQILNPNIKKAYTQPYIRATVGYRILKGRQRKTQAQMEQEREDEYHRIQ